MGSGRVAGYGEGIHERKTSTATHATHATRILCHYTRARTRECLGRSGSGLPGELSLTGDRPAEPLPAPGSGSPRGAGATPEEASP